MKEREYYLSKVLNFSDTYFPNTQGILLTGSINTEFFNDTSDIDVILLSNMYRNIFIESYSYDDLKIQVIMFPMYDMDNVLYREIAQSNGAYIKMLADGTIIRDPTRILRRLQQRAIELYKQGPRAISNFDFNRIRSIVTTRLEDIEGNDNFDDNFYTALDTYNYLLSLYFKSKRSWYYSSKSASRELRQKDIDFYTHFINSFVDFITTKEKNFLIEFVASQLNLMGGELHFSSSRNYSEIVEENNLVIYIANNINKGWEKELQQLSFELKKFIGLHDSKLDYIIFLQPEGRTFKSGLYLIFYCNKKKIEEYLLPLIRLFHSGLSHSIFLRMQHNWHYPYKTNPLELLGSEELQIEIIKYISYINKCSHEQKLEGKELNLYCISVLWNLQYLTCFVQKPPLWNNFCNFMYGVLLKTENKDLLPIAVLEYYAKLNDEQYKQKYLDNQISEYKIDKDPNQLLLLKEIENIYMISTENSQYLFGDRFFEERFNIEDRNILVFVFRLIELVFNALWIDDRVYILYCLSVKK